MTFTILMPPATEPVDVAFAKTFLRVDHDHEDALIIQFLVAARHRVEAMTGRVLITQSVSRAFTGLPARSLRLSKGPVQAIHEMRVILSDDTSAIVPPRAYTLNKRCDPASLSLADTVQWTDFALAPAGVEVDYSCGYGDVAADVPAPFTQAILLLMAQSYERGAASDDRPIPMMVDALLMPYLGARL